MYSGASNFVEGVDNAFVLIFGISLFFLIGLTIVMIVFVVKYSREKNEMPSQVDGSLKLEIIWTVIPLILVLVMFYYGNKGFKPMREVPEDAMTIKTIGKMWEWVFEYENGRQSKDLIIPLNQAVKLELVSPDVIHSLFIPAFRVKEDIVPGYDNYLWFIPQKVGEYEILCTEYCGLRHSNMLAKAKVLPRLEYDSWYTGLSMQELMKDPPGLEVIKKNACTACHSLDGSKIVSSSFKGLFGTKKIVTTDRQDREIVVDEEYIKKSIYEPNKDIVKGYKKGIMKPYEGVVSEEEVDQIIEYLKTLK